MKILTELCYIGSSYHGWQAQKNAPSVQKTVQTAAEKLFGCSVAVTGCSRTDAGVHARQFFCTLEGEKLAFFPTEKIPRAMNIILPNDISVKSARPVSSEFHPRYAAKGKEYQYLYRFGKERDPFSEGRAWMLPGRQVDIEKMDALAKKLVGTHDFTSFCAAGGSVEDKVRTVFRCEVRQEGDTVCLTVSANGFLYNMVRIIAGTLYDFSRISHGSGDSLEDISAVLSAKDRSFAGCTAPPQGLYLNKVFYDERDLI